MTSTFRVLLLVLNNPRLTSPLSARSHVKGLEVNSWSTKERTGTQSDLKLGLIDY